MEENHKQFESPEPAREEGSRLLQSGQDVEPTPGIPAASADGNGTSDLHGETTTSESEAETVSQPTALHGLINGLAFANLPTEEHWLVEGLLRPRSLNLVQGDPGSMKTWLALELMRAVATGTPFLGQFRTKRGACVGIMMDSGEPDLVKQWRRLTAKENADWQGDEARGLHSFGDWNPFQDRTRFWLPSQIDLTNEQFVSQALEDLRIIEHSSTFQSPRPACEYVNHEGVFDRNQYLSDIEEMSVTGVNLVVIDSLSKTHSGNENDNVHMAGVLASARRIANGTGAAVVIIHHLAKPGEFNGGLTIHRARGATSIVANSDCVLMLQAKDPCVSLVSHIRMRGVRLPDFPIKLEADDHVASLIVTDTATDEQREFLAFVRKLDGCLVQRQKTIEWMTERVRPAATLQQTRKRAENAADSLLKSLVECDLLMKAAAGVYRLKEPLTSSQGGEVEPESEEA